MTTLDEAWKWYEDSRLQMRILDRLAGKYWELLPWDNLLSKDNVLRTLEAAAVQEKSLFTLKHLDDLAVVVLFSVFEATVRNCVKGEVEAEVPDLRHPILKSAAQDVLGAIEEGSFFRVTEGYKKLDAGLVEEVNQVRKYRNWVSHGRRGDAPPAVDPRTTYDRLNRFLLLAGIISSD